MLWSSYFVGFFLFSHISWCWSIELDSSRQCEYIPNPITNYAATNIQYLRSEIQCAVFCQYYQNTSKFFAFRNNACLMYNAYPGFTNPNLGMNCTFNTKLGRRYCQVNQVKNVSDALTFCRSNHMKLLSLETAAEVDFVIPWLTVRYCETNSGCSALLWTSGHRVAQQCIWEESGTPINLANFAAPLNTAFEHLALSIKSSNWSSTLSNGTVKHHFVCEMEM